MVGPGASSLYEPSNLSFRFGGVPSRIWCSVPLEIQQTYDMCNPHSWLANNYAKYSVAWWLTDNGGYRGYFSTSEIPITKFASVGTTDGYVENSHQYIIYLLPWVFVYTQCPGQTREDSVRLLPMCIRTSIVYTCMWHFKCGIFNSQMLDSSVIFNSCTSRPRSTDLASGFDFIVRCYMHPSYSVPIFWNFKVGKLLSLIYP